MVVAGVTRTDVSRKSGAREKPVTTGTLGRSVERAITNKWDVRIGPLLRLDSRAYEIVVTTCRVRESAGAHHAEKPHAGACAVHRA